MKRDWFAWLVLLWASALAFAAGAALAGNRQAVHAQATTGKLQLVYQQPGGSIAQGFEVWSGPETCLLVVKTAAQPVVLPVLLNVCAAYR